MSSPERRYYCVWCGDEVTKEDYLDAGMLSRVYCCVKPECERELCRDISQECPECRRK